MFRRGGANLTHDADQILSIEIEDRLSTVPDDGIGTRIAFDLQALAGVVDEIVVGTADDNVVTTAHDDFVAPARGGCGAFDALNDFVLVVEEEDFSAISHDNVSTVVGSSVDVISTGTPDHDVKATIGPDLVGSTLCVIDRSDFRECFDPVVDLEDRFATVTDDDVLPSVFPDSRFGERAAGIPVDVIGAVARDYHIVAFPDGDIIVATEFRGGTSDVT